jgi:hypothetical protein
MAAREHLHVLVDSLPEGALESAHTYLKGIQTWPPRRPEQRPEVETFRKELEQKRQKFLGGGGTGSWAIDRNNKTTGSFDDSEHNWETGEMTVRTFRVHHDFPMEITERLQMKDDDETLEYEFPHQRVGQRARFFIAIQRQPPVTVANSP